MNSATRLKLRTKTGCLTCRRRRKKCNETFPVCGGCHTSGRNCLWPSPGDLLDRRFASHYESRHQEKTPAAPIKKEPSKILPERCPSPSQHHDDESDQSQALVTQNQLEFNAPLFDSVCPLDLLSEAAAFHGAISHGIEQLFSRHFADKYFSLLLLPSCHRAFHDGWLTDIQQLMGRHKSLYYPVLACAASHVFLTDATWGMQDLALTYYSKALRELSTLLSAVSEHENHNALLMSVILLYLHGCLGWGTNKDTPRHVNAATQIINLRFRDRRVGVQSFFDRLALESVIYQRFLVTVGLWSDPAEPGYEYNPEFWHGADKLLDQATLFSSAPSNLDSPILGSPVALFRVALFLREYFRLGTAPDLDEFESIQSEVSAWEGMVLSDRGIGLSSYDDTKSLSPLDRFYRDTSYLFTMVVSLLLEQVVAGKHFGGLPQAVPCDTWQIRTSLEILERHKGDGAWSKCYIGNWPIYTLGLFMESSEHRDLIREDLERRFVSTNTSQATRFSGDLVKIWGRSDKDESD